MSTFEYWLVTISALKKHFLRISNITKSLAEIVNAECYQTDNQLHSVGEEVNANA